MFQSFKQELQSRCAFLGITPFISYVLDNPEFEICSGAGSPEHHHYGDHGLIQHTKEVFDFAENIKTAHNSHSPIFINSQELFISVIWHDYGKIWDYQKNDSGEWGKFDNHSRDIGHLSRSALEFNHWTRKKKNKDLFSGQNINPENILHNILSHHGCRAYGSPVSPASPEAIILSRADSLSARLNDFKTYDKS